MNSRFQTTSHIFVVLRLIPPDVLLCDRYSSGYYTFFSKIT
ncbi:MULTISPECIES: hypothetical protein [Nostoc]|nr:MULTISPECIES: hypothetical protein [Nostoc]MDZ8013308.1 hypothetical protein [Nostoc sp. ZfuVER08]